MARLLSGSGTISGGATQVELDAFVGTTNIATVGTVGTGTWEGTTVAVNQGGTGAATHTASNVLIGAGTSALTSIAPGADGQVLTSTGSVWQSEAVAGGGNILQVVQASTSNGYSNTSNSWWTVAEPAGVIETTELNSKILITGWTIGYSVNYLYFSLRRDITGGAGTDNIVGATYGFMEATAADPHFKPMTAFFIDSPDQASGTTITYKYQSKNHNGSTTNYMGQASALSTMILFEITASAVTIL